MFNAGYKKSALEMASRKADEYQEKYQDTVKHTTTLHKKKLKAVDILCAVDTYIHSLSNRPKELDKAIYTITIRRKNFEKEVHNLEIESKKVDRVSGSVAGAGIAAGAGVAALGPTAAMAIATTFGTASTGTAIATLSGAAATNAALAWIGGGALVAGGGGIAAGEAFLAMAGPVGWAIGGAAIVGGGLMATSKNKKIAKEAERQTQEIIKEIDKLNRIDTKVNAEISAINPLNKGIQKALQKLEDLPYRNYRLFSDEDKDVLMQLMNASEALSKRIGVKIE